MMSKDGKYRVIDGELYRVVEELPPKLPGLSRYPCMHEIARDMARPGGIVMSGLSCPCPKCSPYC